MAKVSRLRDQLYMLQGSRCFYCDRAIAPNDRSLEHIIADSIGGYANDENAVVVCQDANHLLGDASPKRKMMMLKAGGGRIECPKLGACSKASANPGTPVVDHTIDPNEPKQAPRAAQAKPQATSNSPNKGNTTKNASTGDNSNRNGNTSARGQNSQRNKAKKKPRPHLKSTRSVH